MVVLGEDALDCDVLYVLFVDVLWDEGRCVPIALIAVANATDIGLVRMVQQYRSTYGTVCFAGRDIFADMP